MSSTNQGGAGQDGRGPERPRILVADDDRLVLATLSSGLRDAGFEVIEATDGEQALRLAESEKPDLGILDFRMPGLSGADVARRLREGPGVPFLFLSAYGDVELVREAVAEGALGYLVKPLDVPQILPSIEAALARADELQALRRSEFHLARALGQDRTTSVAVGLVMERHRLGREQAFEALRKRARSSRRKLTEVSTELVRSTETANLGDPAPPGPSEE